MPESTTQHLASATLQTPGACIDTPAIEVLSAFRTREANALLDGAAKSSMRIHGAASSREVARSARREVRNPLLALPSVKRIQALPPESQAALRALLLDLRDDSRVRAEHSWRKSKAPLASYHKAVSIYAQHIARLLSK